MSHCGELKDVLRKIANKKQQKSVMESYGTGSFPDEEKRRKAERETVFHNMVKISILVPLWNNKREFQIQMLDSVMNQTYENWSFVWQTVRTKSMPISGKSVRSM